MLPTLRMQTQTCVAAARSNAELAPPARSWGPGRPARGLPTSPRHGGESLE